MSSLLGGLAGGHRDTPSVTSATDDDGGDPAPARRGAVRARAGGARRRRRPPAAAELAAVAVGGRHLPARRRARRRHGRSSPKYVGQRRLIEIAVATLATDRALLLLGVPGTAKTWVSEHLAAAISGDSTLLVQGTAGTTEETLRYGWNYARLLAEGPSEAALVPSPVYRAMRAGSPRARRGADPDAVRGAGRARHDPVREGRCRCPSSTPRWRPSRGFNLIATANDRDRGINELSSALRRRFNTVVLPLPATAEEEMAIVARRVAELGAALGAARRCRPPPTRSAASSRSSASCATASPPTGARASRCRPARCRRPRRSRSSPTAWRSPPTSATARCGRRRRRRHRRRRRPRPGARRRRLARVPRGGGRATATAGATSTTPAATLD